LSGGVAVCAIQGIRHTLEPVRHTGDRQAGLKTLSIKVPRSMSVRVARLAKEQNTTVSAVVREALEHYAVPKKGSFGELASALIGSLAGGPGDLATHPRHLKGYGSWRR
jgi:hypothetical protein